MMIELCQCVLNGKGMPDEWQSRVLVLIFKGRESNVINCNACRGVKLL